jgi:hypothetical protein
VRIFLVDILTFDGFFGTKFDILTPRWLPTAAAAGGAEVSLPGFGKFKIKETSEREGRNPANGEKIKIAASKKLIFSSAKAVKDLLND